MRLVLGCVCLVMISACDSPPPKSEGRPQLLSGALFTGRGTPEEVARAFLTSRAAEFDLDAPGRTLVLKTTREGLAGEYLRFTQLQDGLPVWDGEVIVLVKGPVVRAVNLELRDAQPLTTGAGRTAAEAIAAAAAAVEAPAPTEPKTARVVHVDAQGVTRVAWQVRFSTETPPHDWTVLLDAQTLAELERRDGVKFVNGTAQVFDANPVASTGNTAFVDGNGATTAALDAARYLVTLPRLDGSGFTRGDFADVRTRDAGARVVSMANDFQFSRDNLGFEQANVYFHLNRAQERIQALGFTNVNNRVQGATVDAQNADNSFYSPQSERLSFGLGGVDDAEDGDIVVHEYGHSIQDNQVPGFGGGDEDAMGEGFGDYLAASFGDALAPDAGHPQLADPACVGDWDAVAYSTETPPCLRRVDTTKHWPEAGEGESHADGEIWSAGLWDLRTRLGGDTVDRLVLESHFLLGTSSTFSTATQALVTVDGMLNNGVNGTLIRRRMIYRGLSRALSSPAPSGPVRSIPVSIGPTRDAVGNYRPNADETRTLTVPGATGLILHFATVDFETHSSCLDQSCDNVYLTNGDGDLFQVVGGVVFGGLTSVAVPGDTVNVRLVSDNSQQRYGYRVDRIDVLGNVMDAGLVFDGGMDPFDAGVPVMPDAGRPDAGRPDAGPGDAGVPDAGAPDAGQPTRTYVLKAYGQETLSPTFARGCGCGATSGAEAWLLLAALGVLRRFGWRS